MNIPGRLAVNKLNLHLICALCRGYFIDATTIVECLHTFCKACIVRYLESSKFCPTCDVQVHKTKPLLSIRPDKTLQNIVYKLVPSLYQNELSRRKLFYDQCRDREPLNEEDGGNHVNQDYILPNDSISVALKPLLNNSDEPGNEIELCTRYFNCPANVTVSHLKKLLRAKFDLPMNHPINFLIGKDESLKENYTLTEVAYITNWQKKEPLTIYYKIFFAKKIKFDPEISERVFNLKVKSEFTTVDISSNDDVKCENPSEHHPRQCIVEKGIPLITKIKKESLPIQCDLVENYTCDALEKVIKDSDIGIHCSSDLQVSYSSTYKAIIPAPAKSSKFLDLNSLTIPNIDSIANGPNCINYGLSLLTNCNGILSNIISGNVIDTSKFAGTVLPFGLTLAPGLLCTSYPDQQNISNLLFGQSDDIGSNLILPLATLDATVMPLPSITQQASLSSTLPVENVRTQPQTLLPKENKKHKYIRPKEDPKPKPDKEVQLMITEAGVMLVSGGDNPANHLETVIKPVESEANDLLNKIENDALLTSTENYSEDSNKSDGSDTGERLAQIKQEISTILDTLSKEANDNNNFNIYNSSTNELINNDNSHICNVTSSTMASIVNSDAEKFNRMSNINATNKAMLNINNNIIPAKKEEKLSLKRKETHTLSENKGNGKSNEEKKSDQQKEKRQNECKLNAPSSRKPKQMKAIKVDIDNKTIDVAKHISSNVTKVEKCNKHIDPVSSVCSPTTTSNCLSFSSKLVSSIPNKLSTTVSSNTVSKINVVPIDSKLKVSKNIDNSNSKTLIPIKPTTATLKNEVKKKISKKYQPIGYKTLKKTPKCWNPTISREKLPIKSFHNSPKTNKFFKARNCYVSDKSSCEAVRINGVPSSNSNTSKPIDSLSHTTSNDLLTSQSSEFLLSNNKKISLDLSVANNYKIASVELARSPVACEKLKLNKALSYPDKNRLSTSTPCVNPVIIETATASKFSLSGGLNTSYSANMNKEEAKSLFENPLRMPKLSSEKCQVKMDKAYVSSVDKKKKEVVAKQIDSLSTGEKLDKSINSKYIEKSCAISMNISSESNKKNLNSLNISPQLTTPVRESELNLPPVSTIPCLSYDSSMQVYLQTIASLSNAHHQSRDQMLLNYVAPYSLLPYASCSPVSCSLSPSKSISTTSLTTTVAETQTKSTLVENIPLMQDILRLSQDISPLKQSAPVSEATMTPEKSNFVSASLANNDLNVLSSTKQSSSASPLVVPLTTTTFTSQKENNSTTPKLKQNVPINEKKEIMKKITSPDSKSNCLPPPSLVVKSISQKLVSVSSVSLPSPVSQQSDVVPNSTQTVGKEKDSDKTKNHILQLVNNVPSSFLENNKSSVPISSNSIFQNCNASCASTSQSSLFTQSSSDALSSSCSVAELSIAKVGLISHSTESSTEEVCKDSSSYEKVVPGNLVKVLTKGNGSKSMLSSESSQTVTSCENVALSNLNLNTTAESELNLITPPSSQSTLSTQSSLDNIASTLLSNVITNQNTLSSSVVVNSSESSCPSVSSLSFSSAPVVSSANDSSCMQASILAPSTCPSYCNMQLPLKQIAGHTNQVGALDNHSNETGQTYCSPIQSASAAEVSATTCASNAFTTSASSTSNSSSTSITCASATSTSSILTSAVATSHISSSEKPYTGVHSNNSNHAHLKKNSVQICQEVPSPSSVSKNIPAILHSKESEPVSLIANSSLTILNNLVSLVNVGAASKPTLFSNERTTISTTVKSQTNLEIGHSLDDKKLQSFSNNTFLSKNDNCVSNSSTIPVSIVTASQYKADFTSNALISKQKSDKVQSSVSNIPKGDASNSDNKSRPYNAANAANYSLGSKMPSSLAASASQSTPLTAVSNQDNNLTSAEELDRLLFQSISAATSKSANLSQSHDLPIANETLAIPLTTMADLKNNEKQVRKSSLHTHQNDIGNIVPSLSSIKTIPATVSYVSQCADYNSCNHSNQCLYHNNSSVGCQTNNRTTCPNSKLLHTKDYGSHCLIEKVPSGVIANSSTQVSNPTQVLGTNNSSLPLTANLITKQCTNYPIVSSHSFMPSVTPVYTNEACKISQHQSSQTNQILTESQKTHSSQHIAAGASEQSSKNNVNASAISQNKIEIATSNSSVQSSLYNHDNTSSTTTTQTSNKKVHNNSSVYADVNHIQPSNAKVNYNQNTQEFSSTSFNSMVNNFHDGMSGTVSSNLPSSASHKAASQFSWEGNPFFFNSNSFNGMSKGFPSNSESCSQQNLIRNNDSLTKDANMNSDSQSNFVMPTDSSCSKNSMLNSQYNIDNSLRKNSQTTESYNNFSTSSQKYNTSNSALYNSNYNNNYMNFFSNSQSQVTPSLTSLVSGAAGYNFPLSNSKFNTSQQYFNFGQNMSNNSYFPSTNFNMNCGSNYQNCMNQSSGNSNPSSSNMNSNFGNNFSGSFCNLPLPYYSNCSFSYNSYPYFYQGGDMSLLSNHAAAAASLMPSFSSRSSLSPRNTTSSQSFNDLHLQSGLFPMMPFVSPLSSSVSRSAASPMSMPISPALSMRPFSNTPYPQKSSYGIHQQSSDLLKSSSSTSKVTNNSGTKHKKSNNQSHGGSKLKGSNSGSCASVKTTCENLKGNTSAMHTDSVVNHLQPELYNTANQANFAPKNNEDRGRKEYKPASDNQRSRDKSQNCKGSGGAS